jgi:hypothetical protein
MTECDREIKERVRIIAKSQKDVTQIHKRSERSNQVTIETQSS